MKKEEFNEKKIESKNSIEEKNSDKQFKREKNRFEFALFVNESLVCKRNFPINGYIEKSMCTVEFKECVDEIVKLIDEDLKSKSRIYTTLHLPEFKCVGETLYIPEWEPEICTNPLTPENECVLKFVIYDNEHEVISKIWDGRYYPNYVRKNIDLTNRQVKITKGDKTIIYDKERFFNDQRTDISGELYVLKHMIMDREDLIPIIQTMIYNVCSRFDSVNEKLSDYEAVAYYSNGNRSNVKKYDLNLSAYNKKIDSMWGAVVAEKTRKYMNELYVSPKEKFFKKKEN